MEAVLRGMPDQTATAGQICRAVAENPALSVKLLPTDWLPLSNRKTSPRLACAWQHPTDCFSHNQPPPIF